MLPKDYPFKAVKYKITLKEHYILKIACFAISLKYIQNSDDRKLLSFALTAVSIFILINCQL